MSRNKNTRFIKAIDEFTDELSKDYTADVVDGRPNWNNWTVYKKLLYLLRKLAYK